MITFKKIRAIPLVVEHIFIEPPICSSPGKAEKNTRDKEKINNNTQHMIAGNGICRCAESLVHPAQTTVGTVLCTMTAAFDKNAKHTPEAEGLTAPHKVA